MEAKTINPFSTEFRFLLCNGVPIGSIADGIIIDRIDGT